MGENISGPLADGNMYTLLQLTEVKWMHVGMLGNNQQEPHGTVLKIYIYVLKF